jgi:uncharacterized membrane protein
MNSFVTLLQTKPLIFFHLVTAISALLLGVVILSRRKGTGNHRALGWTWVALMGSTAVASAFIRDYRMPNLFGFTPIHLFTVTVAVLLPLAIWFIKRGNVAGHRKTMTRLYAGGCLIAGIFTLAPSRFLGNLLFKQGLGLIA